MKLPKPPYAIRVPSSLENHEYHYDLWEIKKEITVEEFTRLQKFMNKRPRYGKFDFRGTELNLREVQEIYQYFEG